MLGSITRDERYVTAPYIFYGTICGWSETQTITIGENPTFSPADVAVAVAVIGAG